MFRAVLTAGSPCLQLGVQGENRQMPSRLLLHFYFFTVFEPKSALRHHTRDI